MADDKNLRGERDRSRVAGSEEYELEYVARRYGVSIEDVRTAMRQVGNSREKIEEYLQNKGNRP